MATSLLYHAFGVRGYEHVKTDYAEGKVRFTIQQALERVRAGVWAAVLMGKKCIETAILQGLIQYDGEVERALPLRNAFRPQERPPGAVFCKVDNPRGLL